VQTAESETDSEAIETRIVRLAVKSDGGVYVPVVDLDDLGAVKSARFREKLGLLEVTFSEAARSDSR
jgi:hypothetical protein